MTSLTSAKTVFAVLLIAAGAVRSRAQDSTPPRSADLFGVFSVGPLTRLTCSRVRLRAAEASFETANQEILVQTIAAHWVRPHRSAIEIRTLTLEKLQTDKNAEVALGMIKPGRYVLRLQRKSADAMGTVEISEKLADCTTNLLVSRQRDFWAIGEGPK